MDNLIEQHKITSIDLKDGKLAVTGIDRKWSMLINKIKFQQKDEKDDEK